MKKKLFAAIGMLVLFTLWTVLVCTVDVQKIGPNDSQVGLATMNEFLHNLTGVHMALYHVTDWLSLIPVGFAVGFACTGLIQWFRRKRLYKVDPAILALGGFYVVVMAVFLLFEHAVVNYRPVLIGGVLEASYPSSTTLLVLCIMPTTILRLHKQVKNGLLTAMLIAFTAFMVLGRLISGVHWVSDIVGGCLLSGGLVMAYATACDLCE